MVQGHAAFESLLDVRAMAAGPGFTPKQAGHVNSCTQGRAAILETPACACAATLAQCLRYHIAASASAADRGAGQHHIHDQRHHDRMQGHGCVNIGCLLHERGVQAAGGHPLLLDCCFCGLSPAAAARPHAARNLHFLVMPCTHVGHLHIRPCPDILLPPLSTGCRQGCAHGGRLPVPVQ